MQKLTNKFPDEIYFANGSKGLGTNKVFPWTPSSITTAMWLDADDASTITIATGVSQWNDKSGNGRNAAQATGANQPTVVTGGLNGKNVLGFNGSRWLTHSYSPGTTVSLFTVARTTVTTGYRCLGIFGVNLNLYINYNNTRWGHYNSLDSGYSASNYSILYIERAASMFYRHNAGTLVTRSLTTYNNANVIGAYNSSGAEAMVGNLAELILIESTPSTATRQNIEGYLAWKWGLVAELPNDHPYKYFLPTL